MTQAKQFKKVATFLISLIVTSLSVAPGAYANAIEEMERLQLERKENIRKYNQYPTVTEVKLPIFFKYMLDNEAYPSAYGTSGSIKLGSSGYIEVSHSRFSHEDDKFLYRLYASEYRIRSISEDTVEIIFHPDSTYPRITNRSTYPIITKITKESIKDYGYDVHVCHINGAVCHSYRGTTSKETLAKLEKKSKIEQQRLLEERKLVELEKKRLLEKRRLAEQEKKRLLEKRRLAEQEKQRLLEKRRLAEQEKQRLLEEHKFAEQVKQRPLEERGSTELEKERKTERGDPVVQLKIDEYSILFYDLIKNKFLIISFAILTIVLSFIVIINNQRKESISVNSKQRGEGNTILSHVVANSDNGSGTEIIGRDNVPEEEKSASSADIVDIIIRSLFVSFGCVILYAIYKWLFDEALKLDAAIIIYIVLFIVWLPLIYIGRKYETTCNSCGKQWSKYESKTETINERQKVQIEGDGDNKKKVYYTVIDYWQYYTCTECSDITRSRKQRRIKDGEEKAW